MKKTKKFLAAALAAVMTVSMGSVSASAESVVDINKIVFSIRDYVDYDDQVSLVYEYREFMIDEDGNIGGGSAYKPTEAIVKMADGFELEADETRYKTEKLSKYQIKKMQEEYERHNHIWGHTYGNTFEGLDFDVNDDYYILYFGGINNEDDTSKVATSTKEFCKKILESGKADYAQPIMGMEYNIAVPVRMLSNDYYEQEGLDKSEFINDSFGFTLTFAGAEDAQSFKTDSVADLVENLHVSIIKDNVMYFQFKDETDGKTMANVLCALQDSEEVKKIEAMPYGCLLSGGGTIGEIPKDYPLGDTNYNDKVDLQDVINIAKHMIGTKELDKYQQILADYNDDGQVGLQDVIGVAKQIIKDNKK